MRPETGESNIENKENEPEPEETRIQEPAKDQPVSAENPELKAKISQAKDFMTLNDILQESGGLQGSRKFHSAEELSEKIEAARNGVGVRMLGITNSHGLRDRVEELLKIEKLHRQLEEEKKRGMPAGAFEVTEKFWQNFLRNGAEKLKRMDKDFPNIEKTGWKTNGEPIDGTLLWTDGEGAIFQNSQGLKFSISFESLSREENSG